MGDASDIELEILGEDLWSHAHINTNEFARSSSQTRMKRSQSYERPRSYDSQTCASLSLRIEQLEDAQRRAELELQSRTRKAIVTMAHLNEADWRSTTTTRSVADVQAFISQVDLPALA